MPELLSLNPQQRALIDRLLNAPFETLSSGVTLIPVEGFGYPEVRVSQNDRTGDGVPDEWVVQRPLDDVDGDLSVTSDDLVTNPRDGYLIEELRFQVEDNPNGEGQVLVYQAEAICRQPEGLHSLPLVCRSYQAAVESWAEERLSENMRGIQAFATEFVAPHHSDLSIVSASDDSDEGESWRDWVIGGVALLLGTGAGLLLARRLGWRSPEPVERTGEPAFIIEPVDSLAIVPERPRADGVLYRPPQSDAEDASRSYRIGRGIHTDQRVQLPRLEGESDEGVRRYNSISRDHAEVTINSFDQVYIRDLSSSFGTVVASNHPVTGEQRFMHVSSTLATELRAGDQVRLGLFWYQVEVGPYQVAFVHVAQEAQQHLDVEISLARLPVSPERPGSVYVGRDDGEGRVRLWNATRDVSRRQAEIGATRDGRYLIQTGEVGTMAQPAYLNRDGEVHIVPREGWVELRHGDILEFGSVVYQFERNVDGTGRLVFMQENDGARSESMARALKGISNFPVTIAIDAGDEPVRLTVEAQSQVVREGLQIGLLLEELSSDPAVRSDPAERVTVEQIDAYRIQQLADFMVSIERPEEVPSLTTPEERDAVLRVWEELTPERREGFWRIDKTPPTERGARLPGSYLQTYYSRRHDLSIQAAYPVDEVGAESSGGLVNEMRSEVMRGPIPGDVVASEEAEHVGEEAVDAALRDQVAAEARPEPVRSPVRTGLEELSPEREVPWDSVRDALGEETFPRDGVLETNVRTLGELIRELGTRRAMRLYNEVEAAHPQLTGAAFERVYVGELVATVLEARHGYLDSGRRGELVTRVDQALAERVRPSDHDAARQPHEGEREGSRERGRRGRPRVR